MIDLFIIIWSIYICIMKHPSLLYFYFCWLLFSCILICCVGYPIRLLLSWVCHPRLDWLSSDLNHIIVTPKPVVRASQSWSQTVAMIIICGLLIVWRTSHFVGQRLCVGAWRCRLRRKLSIPTTRCCCSIERRGNSKGIRIKKAPLMIKYGCSRKAVVLGAEAVVGHGCGGREGWSAVSAVVCCVCSGSCEGRVIWVFSQCPPPNRLL